MSSITVARYLIGRLAELGVRHVFGVPGDYVLSFYDQLERSKLAVINTADEQGAGYAADAYARVNGIGAVCVTYGVGGLKVVNTTAQAFAEKSPVIVISGAPGIRERHRDPLLHHKIRTFESQLAIFREVTCAAAIIGGRGLQRDIDRTLACLRHGQPVTSSCPGHVDARIEPRRRADRRRATRGAWEGVARRCAGGRATAGHPLARSWRASGSTTTCRTCWSAAASRRP
jgi:indolepyruvate decarboxylase